MAKKNNVETAISVQDDNTLKKRKKQAKKEAKLMLQLEQTKKDVGKAEQKVTRAQEKLKEFHNHLHDLERALSQLQHPEQRLSEDQQPQAIYQSLTIDPGETYEDDEAIRELHLSSLQPAEGENGETATAKESKISSTDGTGKPSSGTNITSTQDQQEVTPIDDMPGATHDQHTGAAVHSDISINPSPEDEKQFEIKSGEGKMPIETSDEHAWPPPEIREEFAESVKEEIAKEQQEKHKAADDSSSEKKPTETKPKTTHSRRSTRRRTSNDHS